MYKPHILYYWHLCDKESILSSALSVFPVGVGATAGTIPAAGSLKGTTTMKRLEIARKEKKRTCKRLKQDKELKQGLKNALEGIAKASHEEVTIQQRKLDMEDDQTEMNIAVQAAGAPKGSEIRKILKARLNLIKCQKRARLFAGYTTTDVWDVNNDNDNRLDGEMTVSSDNSTDKKSGTPEGNLSNSRDDSGKGSLVFFPKAFDGYVSSKDVSFLLKHNQCSGILLLET